MKTLSELKQQGYIFCLPDKVRLNTGLIYKLQCNLNCIGKLLQPLVTIPAQVFLSKGWLSVDDNGDLISLLDSDIDNKLVIVSDINLYFALKQSDRPDNEILVDILCDMPRGKKWSF